MTYFRKMNLIFILLLNLFTTTSSWGEVISKAKETESSAPCATQTCQTPEANGLASLKEPQICKEGSIPGLDAAAEGRIREDNCSPLPDVSGSTKDGTK